MTISRLRTAWIIFTLCFYTMLVSLRSTLHSIFCKPNRTWTNKALHCWIDQLLNAAKVQYTVVNPHNVQPEPGRATILMCNHSSVYDIPLGIKAFPNHSIRMLAKRELARIPLLYRGMVASEFPFIDRKNRYQAIKDLAFAKQLMESGIILWIAPEGTRSKDGKLHTFKKGGFITAINAQAMIIPIVIRGAFNIIPGHTFQVNLNQKAEIHIGTPIDAREYTHENKDELINRTHEVMKAMLGE